jgi:ribonuclease HI
MDDEVLPRGIASGSVGPVRVFFDGACEEVRGRRIAAYGYTLEGAGLRHEDCGLAVPPGHPRATNNVAEYVGAVCALEWLVRHGYSGPVVIAGDSQLVVRQMTGEYRVLKEHLVPYHERLKQLVGQFAEVQFLWVPRTENTRADELSKLGIERGVGAPSARRDSAEEPPPE